MIYRLEPRRWSAADVAAWVQWARRQLQLPSVPLESFNVDGATLASLTEEEFCQRAPQVREEEMFLFWKNLKGELKNTKNFHRSTVTSNPRRIFRATFKTHPKIPFEWDVTWLELETYSNKVKFLWRFVETIILPLNPGNRFTKEIKKEKYLPVNLGHFSNVYSRCRLFILLIFYLIVLFLMLIINFCCRFFFFFFFLISIANLNPRVISDPRIQRQIEKFI